MSPAFQVLAWARLQGRLRTLSQGWLRPRAECPSSAQPLPPRLHNGSSTGVNHKLNREDTFEKREGY